MECKLCGDTITLKGLEKHLEEKHEGITKEEYTDEYIKPKDLMVFRFIV